MLRVLVLCASITSAGTAFATTGGPTEIEVLGYDKHDHKIYFVETHHDESGRMPQIYFVTTAGPRIGKLTRVESIQRDVDRAPDPDGLLGRRVDRLRRRLRTLQPLGGAPVRDEPHGRISRKLDKALGVTRKQTGSVQALDMDRQPQSCGLVELGLTHGQRSGTITLADCHPGSTGVVSAHAIPGGSATFVVVSSRPALFELGYATERPLLLVRTVP